jgi:hypothetical protein
MHPLEEDPEGLSANLRRFLRTVDDLSLLLQQLGQRGKPSGSGLYVYVIF